MFQVDNRKTIDSVSACFMKANKGRNMIVVLAIVMTAVMFTSLFTAAASVVKSQQQHEMRQTMSSSDIIVQNMTEEEFHAVKKYGEIESSGYTIFMTVADNPQLAASQTEIRYGDQRGVESFLSLPTKGHLPQAYDEIALSTITLDLLGVPSELGTKITLDFTVSGEKQSHDFVLSGYWKGEPLAMAQEAWVSMAFCQANAKKATVDSLERGDYEGEYSLAIWCSNPFNLNKYAEEIEESYLSGITAAKVAVNPAVNFFEEDAFPFGSVAALLFIVFASGYLIIYNVFNISVVNDIRAYGLLKNIGTTGKQLKKIVRKQALYLSVVGIPLGLILGYCVGRSMTPYLLLDTSSEKMETVMNTHPIIFAAAAVFSLFTVYIGCMQPCRIAAKISPIEAVRMTEQLNSRSGRPTTRRSNEKISPYGMAVSTMKRNWKKSVLVVVSLALPIVVLNSTYCIAKGFNFDHFVSTYCSYDFQVSGLTHNRNSSNLQGITPEVAEQLADGPNVESVSLIYESEAMHQLDELGYANLKSIIEKAVAAEYLEGYRLERETEFLESRNVFSHMMGVDKSAFDKMAVIEGEGDYEKFQSGKYVVLKGLYQGFGQFYYPGDKVKVQFQNGRSGEYTVLCIADTPYSLSFPFGNGTAFDYEFYLPESEYIRMEGTSNAMLAGVEVKEGTHKQYDKWLSNYIEQSEKPLYVESKLSVLEECKGFSQKYYVILGLLCIVLFLIGLLNFFNTSSVTIMARKKELSLLEAVGMSKRQLRKMLMGEGLIYAVAAMLAADTIGTALAYPLIQKTVGRVFYFNCEMTIVPSFVIFPLLALLAVAIPMYNYKKMQKETIVERLRSE